jgi:hypothetical protein
MAAFTAEDQTDRRAFLNRTSRLRSDPSVSHRVIDVDGAVAGTIGCFRIDNQLEVTFWVDRAQWGKGIASAALQILLAETGERPLRARAASDTSVRFEYWRRLGSDALASTAASHTVAVRRSRKRSCASTEERRWAMTKVVAIMSMSLDGYVADANDGVAEVFDWYFSGDVEVPTASPTTGFTFRVSAPSAEHLRA